ncbi:MAG TPA: PEP/pyruvate-binding domain-containing protein, partial [Candidatus Limnocylindrales bacterium]|nr:PEP/pyruvate-binding domain-containing protein [Candidatus Limnocylindrales bacterium]
MSASVTGSNDAIEWLGELRSPVEVVGGKAASLDRLARGGFLVPPGFCLTTAAFGVHVEEIAARAPLREALGALPDESARRVVVELVRDTALPARLATALATELERLADAGESALAVRSSAVGEDSRHASFAGLHDTELGLEAEAVDAAVRRCWASLWSPEALAYRQHRGVAIADAAMAVVVQALVPADAAAVAFTRHPVTGRDDELVVTAVRGLGEPMVSGLATPDTIVIERSSGEVTEYTPGDDGERLLATDGSVRRGPVAAVGPVLSPSQVDELVALALSV